MRKRNWLRMSYQSLIKEGLTKAEALNKLESITILRIKSTNSIELKDVFLNDLEMLNRMRNEEVLNYEKYSE